MNCCLTLLCLLLNCSVVLTLRVSAMIARQRKKDDRATYENVEEEQAARNPLDVSAGQEDANTDLWLLGGVDAKTRL